MLQFTELQVALNGLPIELYGEDLSRSIRTVHEMLTSKAFEVPSAEMPAEVDESPTGGRMAHLEETFEECVERSTKLEHFGFLFVLCAFFCAIYSLQGALYEPQHTPRGSHSPHTPPPCRSAAGGSSAR